MKKQNTLSYNKNISFLNNISISPNVKVVILYTHFMHNSKNKWVFEPHSHSFHELHMIVEGSCSMDIGNAEMYMPKNSLVLIPPKAKHRFVRCSNDFFRFSLAFDIICRQNQTLYAKPPAVLPLGKKSIFYIGNIMSEYEKAQLGYKNVTDALVRCLLIEVLRSAEAFHADTVPVQRFHPALGKALQFIGNNIPHRITAHDAASAVHLSLRQLDRLFCENVNMTVTQYIKSKKIENIKEYLKKTDLGLKEIAFLTGIENESVLCKLFKRETGLTPGEYRRKD